eukprot:scaffold1289_cov274-Pinguiococcus_pyrenoidosus.AAC.9
MSPLNPTTSYTKTTYGEHESKQVLAMLSQLLLAVAIVSFLHLRLGINHSLLLQSITAPLTLYENGLVQKYLLKSEGRVYKEKFEDELTPQEREEAEQAGGTGTAPVCLDATDSVDELMSKAWDSGDPVELIAALDANTVNCRNKLERWSPLMVVAGLKGDFRVALEQLMSKGADVFITDNDGWTCLHWGSFHGNADAVRFLTDGARESRYSVAKLMSIKDSEGKTALEIAQKELSQAEADKKAEIASALRGVLEALEHAEKRINQNTGPLDGLDD